MTQVFQNPILSGFYPDPSICRVGEDYYMVTSSFAYFPGLPIFHSKDLVHWEQIGHGIHRADQLDYKNCEMSLGLWAPTIRYHEGIFYIINTFVSGGREVYRDNFIITARDPRGPWSNPVFIEGADGIDPSLFFDDDNTLWYTGNYISDDKLYEGHHGIYLQQLDPDTLQFIGERKNIWDGNISRSKWIEAPHLYKINGMYYLITAEGGTFTNHSVMMARSTQIQGEYEICPRNPIVSHRHLPLLSDISVTGHADIIRTQNDEWWMVLLAVRPYEGFHYNTGRETFLIPITWAEDGWPLVDNHNGLVNITERRPNLEDYPMLPPDPCDNFESPTLSLLWNMIHQPTKTFYSLADRPGYLRLSLSPEVIEEISSPALIARRQQDPSCTVKTAFEFTPCNKDEEAGIVALQDDRYNYIFTKTQKDGSPILRLSKTEAGNRTIIKEIPLSSNEKLYLTVHCSTSAYHFYYGLDENQNLLFMNNLPASLLSSNTNEGFTGAYIGMYASSNRQDSENFADFDWFHYYK
ncbi:glycoside hydrolase family 43 protein [Kineothrix sp. MB12-C1]|uniref:glycoside hydrolase family 43 protein n=1 Tax=Kineothrix sp. MB12-C1 TaxID=3070215 RepID=UPI0027D23449|nr:glycoside hydrolase family 43 protein [Kineothrix sp. MB12-C1]WMC91719.1 glycoside hydrolase family 43 protein [Kineothrix sp. MB12-C1]